MDIKQLSNPLRYLIFTASTLILFWVLYATIVFLYTSILTQSTTTAMISSLIATLLFMVFGTATFGGLAFIVRKINPYSRVGVFVIIPFAVIYSVTTIRDIYNEWPIEYGFDPYDMFFKSLLIMICFLILFMTYKVCTILSDPTHEQMRS